jgi:hypothetical protein
VAHWLKHYPRKTWVTEATWSASDKLWTVKIWSGPAGEVATGKVDDPTSNVTEAWTGPQVAWKMARGYDGAFGGKQINAWPVWVAFCALFLVGLADLRRPFSLRNLDLLVLLSFSISLWKFNEGHVFSSAALVYPPLFYLLFRAVWVAWRGRSPTTSRPVWPVWVLAAATVFTMGFRIGLNVRDSNVIDVGYSGVIGAQRIVNGQSPYGHFPNEGSLKACGPKDADGEIRERIQTNGRCESANPSGDTYGPVAYEAYVPGYLALGWTGKWDDLPAAHFTSIAFDLICLAGLALLGWRWGGSRLAVTLAFAWAAYPFTQYVSSSNTNDAIPPAFLILGLAFVTMPVARGVAAALSGWTKFGALVVAPAWLSYPERSRREQVRFLAAFALATLVAFSVLLLEPTCCTRSASSATARRLADRPRVAVLDLGLAAVPRGLPDLHLVQRALEVLLVARRGRLVLRPAAEVAAPARRAHRRAADRLRARADALVLPLHPVVLPVRRRRGARGRAAAEPAPAVARDREARELVPAG